LLKMLLRPYASAGGPSIEISGGDGHVGKSTATCLALMVHELATNALKHGALSCPNGRLKVRIRLTAERLSLVWHESGGPELGHVPDQQGFGTALIDRVTRGGQTSRVRRWWRRDGLVIGLWLRLVPQNRECSTA